MKGWNGSMKEGREGDDENIPKGTGSIEGEDASRTQGKEKEEGGMEKGELEKRGEGREEEGGQRGRAEGKQALG